MRNAVFARFCDTVGDGTGTKNATGDYSSTATTFRINGTVRGLALHRLIVCAEDTTGMQAEEYGNLGNALTNGITLTLNDSDNTEIEDLTDGVPIKTNSQWGALCYDVDVKSWGAGNELLVARFSFDRFGGPVYLNDGDSFRVNLNDDFDETGTGLIAHYFMVQGTYP